MNMELKPALEERLSAAARARALSVPELVEKIVTEYLDAQPDDLATWAAASRQQLEKVWGVEDFSSWCPPHGT